MLKRLLFLLAAYLPLATAAGQWPTLYELLILDPDYRSFAQAFELIGWRECLDGPGEYTLLIPIDPVLKELEPLFDDPENSNLS